MFNQYSNELESTFNKCAISPVEVLTFCVVPSSILTSETPIAVTISSNIVLIAEVNDAVSLAL